MMMGMKKCKFASPTTRLNVVADISFCQRKKLDAFFDPAQCSWGIYGGGRVMNEPNGLCTCTCHIPGSTIKHIIACCDQCSGCGKNVRNNRHHECRELTEDEQNLFNSIMRDKIHEHMLLGHGILGRTNDEELKQRIIDHLELMEMEKKNYGENE
jgi:hypothetical protein